MHLARPADTIQDVASRMAKGGFGFVPVADGDQLIGTITDRDIVVRALATGAASSASVVEFITRDPQTVLDTDDVFALDPAAPAWVRSWSGPFTIRLRRA